MTELNAAYLETLEPTRKNAVLLGRVGDALEEHSESIATLVGWMINAGIIAAQNGDVRTVNIALNQTFKWAALSQAKESPDVIIEHNVKFDVAAEAARCIARVDRILLERAGEDRTRSGDGERSGEDNGHT